MSTLYADSLEVERFLRFYRFEVYSDPLYGSAT